MHALELIALGGGLLAGFLGALVGVGGGVLLVPMFNSILGMSFAEARGLSLIGVLGTSASAEMVPAGRRLVNVKLALFLLIFSISGAWIGAKYLTGFPDRTYELIFGATTGVVAVLMLMRRNTRNVLPADTADLGAFGGLIHDCDTGRDVTYRVKRLPVASGVSFAAGVLASIIGIGGGIVIVPTLNSLCGVPMRVAAATSVLMIGITAIPPILGAWMGGHLGAPLVAGTTCLGAVIGFQLGRRVGPYASVKWLKLGMAGLLTVVSIQYLFLK
ncbi:MAG TPA: sulfite exporter TauE/SafE family protein [Vicinamibacterales bacterium]|nr:sulfite exporter TauE/SafE family protein [Vicinamibacterales bacterium]